MKQQLLFTLFFFIGSLRSRNTKNFQLEFAKFGYYILFAASTRQPATVRMCLSFLDATSIHREFSELLLFFGIWSARRRLRAGSVEPQLRKRQQTAALMAKNDSSQTHFIASPMVNELATPSWVRFAPVDWNPDLCCAIIKLLADDEENEETEKNPQLNNSSESSWH